MSMKDIRLILFGLLTLCSLNSCNDFLDELPDNRTELDNNDKIRKLLVSAYPSTSYALLTEISSDNVDDYGQTNPNTTRMLDQIAYWIDVTESDNDEPLAVWESSYLAIAHANQALAAIEELGSPEELLPEKGEALITRAYGHFLLVNIFAKHYNTISSTTDLGIPYLREPETTLNPSYERMSVASVYENINLDIEEGLPLINNDIYDVPSYHFNQRASYAFAARFNLFYEKWEKAKEYATKAITSNPSQSLRDWTALGNLPQDTETVSGSFVNNNSNLLVQAHGSDIGLVFGAFFFGSRFNHTRKIADEQTLFAPAPWSSGPVPSRAFNFSPFVYSASNLDKTLLYKIPYRFEFTDPVARIGFRRTILVPFSTDESLLVRAEAKILLGELQEGLNDILIWSNNFYNTSISLNIEDVDDFYDRIPFSSPSTIITQKKPLSPKFNISSGTQENLIHYVLQCRRILTVHEGLRWFDIKRYGIEVPRLQNQLNGNYVQKDLLTADDLRKAIQIPPDVVSAGITPNPR